jgi:hypothetical protein
MIYFRVRFWTATVRARFIPSAQSRDARKGHMKKKEGISAPGIIGELSSALCSEPQLLPFEFGNNFG